MSEASLLVLRASGWLAALALLGALAATPLGRLRKRALSFRRPLGIASALGALTHAGLGLGIYVGQRWWEVIPSVAWLRSGALALALLLPLLVTSFPSLVKRFEVRLWKPLHRLAYVAAALALHHLVLSPFAPRSWAIGFGIALVVLAVARLVPHRDRMVVNR